METQKELRNDLQDLLDLDDGLTDWEIKFIDSMSHHQGDFTEPQAAKIIELWDKHF